MTYPRISKFKTSEQFQNRLDELGINLPFDEHVDGSDGMLGESFEFRTKTIGNRFSILPMEGWDGTTDGKPTDLTLRRWSNFGKSGAKLIWGGEAVAVRHDGRANPNQLVMTEQNLSELENLRLELVQSHQATMGSTEDLLIGLQLTHSGRFARPNQKDRLEARTGYQHPVLDKKFSIDADQALLSDDELKTLIDDFVNAAVRAEKIGFEFVDVKHCHGYLGHELLSGYDRQGEFGGSLENRTRFLREIVSGIRAKTSLEIGTRISVFDFVPFQAGEDGIGIPSQGDYGFAFGGDGIGQGINLAEPHKFLDLLTSLNVNLVCTTAGSPYYNPHIQRPALFPPSDGYQPPEDPLVGVARQINATADLKKQHPDLVFVGSAYSYLQEWLPNVGQRVVRDGMADFVGLGRMVLSYPELPADVLAGREMARKKICRTFSDCTTGPRNGMVSGCFPLDPFYKARPENEKLKVLKKDSTI